MACSRWIVDPAAFSAVMTRRNLTGAALARLAHVSPSLVRNLRNGAYSVTTGTTLSILCGVLDCTPGTVATPHESTPDAVA
jgi:DNA-binding Xre family transcriptional regulator